MSIPLTVDGVAAQQNVLRLQVQVGDLLAVQMLQGAQDLAHARLRLALRQRAVLVEQRLQLTAGRTEPKQNRTEHTHKLYHRSWPASRIAS